MKKEYNHYSENKLELLINSKHFPLLNNKYLDTLDEKLTNKLTLINNQTIPIVPSVYPKFKNITPENIINLRLCLQVGLNEIELKKWCEKILRYIEINMSKLRQNEKLFNRSRQESISIYQHIKALFVEFYLKYFDIIYLNTAIKISEFKWVKPTAKTPIPVRELDFLKNRQIEYIIENLIND